MLFVTDVAVPDCIEVQRKVYVVSAVMAEVVWVPLVPDCAHESPAELVITHEPDTTSVALHVRVVVVPFFTVDFGVVRVRPAAPCDSSDTSPSDVHAGSAG